MIEGLGRFIYKNGFQEVDLDDYEKAFEARKKMFSVLLFALEHPEEFRKSIGLMTGAEMVFCILSSNVGHLLVGNEHLESITRSFGLKYDMKGLPVKNKFVFDGDISVIMASGASRLWGSNVVYCLVDKNMDDIGTVERRFTARLNSFM